MASLLTSYNLYKSGLVNENMFYVTGFIVGGLAIDVAETSIKVADKVVNTTKATEKIAKLKNILQIIIY